MTVDPTAAERQQRRRDRIARRLPPAIKIPCDHCPRLHTGVHGTLCVWCWRRTPDGKAHTARRVAATYKRKHNNL